MTAPIPEVGSRGDGRLVSPTASSTLRPRELRAERDRDPSPANEQDWVASVRSGDAGAFERMFDAYSSSLLAFAAARLRSREAAEELVQQLFTTIWVRRSQWVVRRSLKTYLFQALRNRVLNYRRDTRVRERFGLSASADADVLTGFPAPEHADDRLGEGELRRAVAAAIAALPERNREVFLLVRQHRLSYAEAADVLAISPKAVEQHMVRAFHVLRVRLADWRI